MGKLVINGWLTQKSPNDWVQADDLKKLHWWLWWRSGTMV